MNSTTRRVPKRLTLLLALAAGCGADNGGLTNGPPPTVSGSDASARTDLPTPPPSDQGEILGKTGDNSTDAGTGGRGGGSQDTPQP